jgi:hypothetical protein
MGRIVSHDISIESLSFSHHDTASVGLAGVTDARGGSAVTMPERLDVITAAVEAGVVAAETVRTNAFVVVFCGALGGGALFSFLFYVFFVNHRGSRPDPEEPSLLIVRKSRLSITLTAASIALSLGVAVIHEFLGWGLRFLEEDSRRVAEFIVNGGTSYYGSVIALAVISGSAVAFMYLHEDIEQAAKAAIKSDVANPALKVPDPDWRKDNDLEFEPVKTLSTIVVALGPVLTSGFLNAIGGSVP